MNQYFEGSMIAYTLLSERMFHKSMLFFVDY